MIKLSTKQIEKIQTASYYKYLLRNQLLNKVITNIYRPLDILRPSEYRHQRQLDTFKQLKEQGLKSLLKIYGIIPFYMDLSIEGENFWREHNKLANKEAYEAIQEYTTIKKGRV